MRVMVLSSASVFDGFPYGGAEISLALLGRELGKLGHDVTFAAYSRIRRGENWWPRTFKDQKDAQEVALFRPMTGGALPLVQAFNHHQFTSTVKAVCLQKDIKVIYCTYEPEVLSAALAARRACPQVRVVMRMAGLAWYEVARADAAAQAQYDHWFSQVDAINFLDVPSKALTNERMNELKLGQGRDASADFTADIGVDTTRIAAAVKGVSAPHSDGPLSLIMVARFSDYQKRQDVLLRAVALARQKVPMHLTLVGGAPETWGRAQALIAELGIADSVTLRAFVQPQETLWQLMAQTDLMCHACDYEGVSKAILEAMAAGCPVLASDVAPLNQMIEAEQTGFLADNDPEAWATALIRLQASPAKRQTAATQARAWVAQAHGLASKAAVYAQAFEQLERTGT